MMNADIRSALTPDWVTLLLLGSLLLLAISRYYFPQRFLSFLSLPFNGKYLAIFQSDTPLTGFHVLISLFQLINTSLFLYFLSRLPGFEGLALDGGGPYLKYLLGVGGWLSLKILLQWVHGYIFDNPELMGSLIYSKTAFFNFSGLIFFSANVLIAYVKPVSSVLIIALGVLALLINTLGALTLTGQHLPRIYAHFMYFILYICTLEIAPLILAGGYLKT